MPMYDFTITGDIHANDEQEATKKLEAALATIDPNAEIDLSEQDEPEEEEVKD